MGVSALGGVCSWGVSAPRGCLLWGCLLQGVYAPGGVCSQGVCSWGSAPGGVCSRGCLLLGDVCSQGCVCSWGGLCSGGCACSQLMSAPGGCGIPACTEADTPPPMNRMTNSSKNITLATTSLRPVKMEKRYDHLHYIHHNRSNFFQILG